MQALDSASFSMSAQFCCRNSTILNQKSLLEMLTFSEFIVTPKGRCELKVVPAHLIIYDEAQRLSSFIGKFV
jgi:hypothetical protein